MSINTPNSRAASDDEDGFTLIELLVAMTLLALISALLFAGIQSARQAAEFTEQLASTVTTSAVQNFLRNAFSQTHSLPWLDIGRDDATPVFIGTKAKVSFLSGYVPQGQFAGLYRYDLGLDVSTAPGVGQDLAVVLTLHRPSTPSAATSTAGAKSSLVKNVSAIEFSYFVADNDSEPPSWRDSWSHAFRLPILVAVTLKLAPGNPQVWPKMIVSLPISQR